MKRCENKSLQQHSVGVKQQQQQQQQQQQHTESSGAGLSASLGVGVVVVVVVVGGSGALLVAALSVALLPRPGVAGRLRLGMLLMMRVFI
ncbi:hypothetical protein EYF80_019474 [Liparis tanakae]|uniref:Uncharacterized protein n=1 Tax=Liparis tanakae TaxID=230148 RepID=A0A4Z2HXJ6_9TELE|nr:hypothetical protein EYF80_019474 [Liparis tanakae]